MLKALIETDAGIWSLPLRLSLGVTFIAHGSQKLFGWFGGQGLQAWADMFANRLGFAPGLPFAALAGAGELVGAVLVAIGLFTRFGATSIAIVMAVAMFKVHWGSFFLPTGIEFTLALFCSAVALMFMGGGSLSLDSLIQIRWLQPSKRRKKRAR